MKRYQENRISRTQLVRNVLFQVAGVLLAMALAWLAEAATQQIANGLIKFIAGMIIGLLAGMGVGFLVKQMWGRLVRGDCFVAHLPWRAVPGTTAPRNDRL